MRSRSAGNSNSKEEAHLGDSKYDSLRCLRNNICSCSEKACVPFIFGSGGSEQIRASSQCLTASGQTVIPRAAAAGSRRPSAEPGRSPRPVFRESGAACNKAILKIKSPKTELLPCMEQTVRLIDTDSVLRRYGSGKGLFRDEIGFVRCMKMLCLTCDVGVTLLSIYLF